jgi:hypothetical protein
MRVSTLLFVIIALGSAVCWAQHWPAQPAGATGPASLIPAPAAPNGLSVQPAGSRAPATAPSPPPSQPAAQPPSEAGFVNPQTAEDTGTPQYPYPAHHNPYYDERYPANRLSGTLDRMRHWSTQMADRVSGLMDRNFYPRQPATHGGGTPETKGSVPQGPATGSVEQGTTPVQPFKPGTKGPNSP